MNKKRRMRNRETAKDLKALVWQIEDLKHTCPECGERGRHWMSYPMTLEHVVRGLPPQGFWTCAKFYDPVTGMRLVA